MSLFHVTRREDLPSILMHGLEPRTGPRSQKLGEPFPAVYLFPDLEAVENAFMNWLNEEFDEVEVVVLEIDRGSIALSPGAGFELLSKERIAPSAILNVLNQDFEIEASAQTHPVLALARVELACYLIDAPEEEVALARLANQLTSDSDLFTRSNMKGHITASALILSPDGGQVLMIHHNIYDRLLNPGGHHEGTETLLEAALREGGEETGAQDLVVHAWSQTNGRPFDIDSHAIAQNAKKGEGEHFHHDFMYLLSADPSKPLVPQIEEVKAANWFPTSDLAQSGHARLERLYAKLVANGLTPACSRSPRP